MSEASLEFRTLHESRAPEETRQQYATTRIQEWQRYSSESVSFEILLVIFRGYGHAYDMGYRSHDVEDAA